MHGGTGDPAAPLYIFGTVTGDVKVAVIRFDRNLNCGEQFAAEQGNPLDVERDDTGYYAEDSSLSGSEKGENVTFGIRVQRANETPRTIRIVASYPSENIAVPPTSHRLDLTAVVLDAAYKSGTDDLICL